MVCNRFLLAEREECETNNYGKKQQSFARVVRYPNPLWTIAITVKVVFCNWTYLGTQSGATARFPRFDFRLRKRALAENGICVCDDRSS